MVLNFQMYLKFVVVVVDDDDDDDDDEIYF